MIVSSAITPATYDSKKIIGAVLYEEPILTHPDKKRILVVVPVEKLGNLMRATESSGATFEHVYDFTGT